MEKYYNIPAMVFAAIGGFFGWLLGGLDGFLLVLIVFIAADYITGVLVAVNNKKLSSAVGFKGLCKKMLILFIVIIANMLDVYIIQNGAVLRTAAIFFYMANEGISLLENAAALGVPVPDKLRDALIQIRKRDDNDEHKTG